MAHDRKKPIQVPDERAAMRLLAGELDFAMTMISLLASKVAFYGEMDAYYKSIEDARPMRKTLEAVDEFLRKMGNGRGYSIKKKDGWLFDQQLKECIKKLSDYQEKFKGNVVEKITNPGNLNMN